MHSVISIRQHCDDCIHKEVDTAAGPDSCAANAKAMVVGIRRCGSRREATSRGRSFGGHRPHPDSAGLTGAQHDDHVYVS